MKTDEFAFFNQQLAAMLRSGIPLEGALKQLCAGMKVSPLLGELQALEADLAAGTPLKDALAWRQLPEFYKRMVELGVRSNDLPGVLTLLADHYHRSHVLLTRLKGLMVYPLIVVFVSLGLSLILSLTFGRFLVTFLEGFGEWGVARPQPFIWLAGLWFPPAVFAVAAVIGVATVSIPALRSRLRWRLPAFREANLAQLASGMALMLRNGLTLPEALALAQGLESTTPAGPVLAGWQRLVESGQGKPTQWPAPAKPIPPLFLWLVQSGGEDPAAGFQKAADIYHARASYRIELALYGALPISILLLGLMVFWQVAPVFGSLAWVMNMIGAMSGN
jgi:type II secretory pathway component PulF